VIRLPDHVSIRKATGRDLRSIDALATAHRKELGFVRRVALAESIRRGEILVAENDEHVVGLVHYRRRLDQQTTLYNIVVSPDRRQRGIGRRLIRALIREVRSLGKQCVVLKCPSDLPANKIYARLGFRRWREEPGKRWALTLWRLSI